MIIDTHCHIDQLADIHGALARAHEFGVTDIVAISMDLKSCLKNLELKRTVTEPRLHIGMGMHPSEANRVEVDQIVDLIRAHSSELTVIGEIGLDFWYKWVTKDEAKKDEQREIFRKLLAIAKELDLPAVIHSRGCWRETLDIVLEMGIKKAEFHWYSGPVDVMQDILAAGFYVSTSPSVAYSNPSKEAMMAAPLDRILIETDSPVYYRLSKKSEEGFHAEPRDVFKTLKAMAELKGISEEEALEVFNGNAKRFFGI